MTIDSKYLIIYLDLLGAKERIKNPSTANAFSQLAYDMTYSAKINEQNNYISYKAFTFSDNVIYCVELEDESEVGSKLNDLARIVAFGIGSLIAVPSKDNKKGFLTPIRGAITMGNLFIDETKNFIIGEALVRAYELESKVAIFPRVIIDKELETRISADLSVFKLSDDGYLFIDYLSHLSSSEDRVIQEMAELLHIEIDECVEAIIKCDKNAINVGKRLEKYIWLAKYFNNHIKKISRHSSKVLTNIPIL